MTPEEAIETAEQIKAETRYRNQLGREMYQAGLAEGWREGYAAAGAERDRAWSEIARRAVRITAGPDHAELEGRRWGPGGRAHFGDPRPGDFPGRVPAQRQPEPEPELEAEIA